MHILRLMDRLESSQRTVRQKAIRGLLYLLQGNFGDCELEEDQITWARRNVHMCIEAGLLSVACQVLLLEIAYDKWSKSATTCEDPPKDQDFATNKESVITTEDSEPAQPKKGTLCMADSADLRAILSVLYIMVETVRDGLMSGSAQSPVNCGPAGVQSLRTHCSTQDPSAKLREQFLEELSSPIVHDSNTTLTAVLFDMVHRFCSGLAPHFPMKKVLLLLWKVLLVTLGPTTTLCAQKNLVRARWGLPPLFEDSHQVVRRIRATSPPGASNDQALSRGARPNNRHAMFGQSNQAPRQGILANSRCNLNSQRYQSAAISSAIYSFSTSPAPLASSATEAGRTEYSGYATPRPGSPVTGDTNGATEQVNHPVHSRIETPLPILNRSVVTDSVLPQPPPTAPHLALGQGLPNIFADSKSLPWKPKVRKKDLETFLNNVRLKFLKFQVPNDTTSLIGLPEPIHEAVKVLREHLYVSLGEMQIEKEEKIIRYPMSLMSDWSVYCWRNLFSCINLLRILNMLTKWKHSRTMLLVVFKSAPILKRALRVRHAMLQLYVLKLLKLQSRYFGRQWRKNNMPIMSAIYQKVRHRLTDDWAYGNDVDAVPWRFQLEEQTLRANVDQFNRRRYSDACFDPELQPVDNSLTSVLGQPFKLSDEFKRNYEKWLEEEVFSVPINWSQLLAG
ncbi:unnamed protein product [Dicrocoelium dendriticum]|nr:unnamed protein product [Dicrocoelium dendriticum]